MFATRAENKQTKKKLAETSFPQPVQKGFASRAVHTITVIDKGLIEQTKEHN